MNRLPIFFTVEGEPQGKGRPRFTKAGRTYTPQNTVDYEKRIRSAFNEWAHAWKVTEPIPKGEPLFMRITAVYGIPKGTSKMKRSEMLDGKILPTKKPDYDNIGKVVSDALNALAYHDDAQITFTEISKRYGDDPRVTVYICYDREVDPND